MPLKFEDVKGFLATWVGEMEDFSSVGEFERQLREALQQPVLDDRGCEGACLAKAANVMVRA